MDRTGEEKLKDTLSFLLNSDQGRNLKRNKNKESKSTWNARAFNTMKDDKWFCNCEESSLLIEPDKRSSSSSSAGKEESSAIVKTGGIEDERNLSPGTRLKVLKTSEGEMRRSGELTSLSLKESGERVHLMLGSMPREKST